MPSNISDFDNFDDIELEFAFDESDVPLPLIDIGYTLSYDPITTDYYEFRTFACEK